MQYKALKNFKIGRTMTQAGEIYSGGDLEYLLGLGLIVALEGEAQAEPDPLEEPVEPIALAEPEVEPESPPKKGKKKKG